MQIDRSRPVRIPLESAPTPTGNAATPGAENQTNTRPKALADAAPSAPQLGSAVLNIQSTGSAASAADISKSVASVYSNSRQHPLFGSNAPDIDNKTLDHQLALDRNAGVQTKLSINKDGILTATRQPKNTASDLADTSNSADLGGTKQPGFLSIAVSAMREFTDEVERIKQDKQDSLSAKISAPDAPMSRLQQFAAKLNVFA